MTILTWLPLDAGFALRYTKHLNHEQKGLFLDLYITAIETSKSDPEFLTKLLTLNSSEENNQKVIHLVNHLVSVGFFEYLNSLIIRQISRFGTLRENGKKGGRPNNQKVTIKKEIEKERENKKDNKKEIEEKVLALRLNEFVFSLADMEVFKNRPIGDVVPDVFMIEALSRAIPEDEIWKQWEKFTNYFQSADSRKPLKKDWISAWRNWIVK